MAEVTREVCDGRPSYVEQTLAHWLALGRHCPWGASEVSLEDRRR
jgi:hypothetical protein